MEFLKRFIFYGGTNSLSNKLRRKRFKKFIVLIEAVDRRPLRILDIGGTSNFWDAMGASDKSGLEITLLNLKEIHVRCSFMKSIVADARDLSCFSDKEFDVVFSNSLLEHLSEFKDQENLAREMLRIGKAYWVQTPNFYFPIEPHFFFPFFQFLPLAVRAFLLRNFKLGWHERVKDVKKSREIVKSVRLLKKHELVRFFPEGEIYKEKFCGLTKSLTIYGGFNRL